MQDSDMDGYVLDGPSHFNSKELRQRIRDEILARRRNGEKLPIPARDMTYEEEALHGDRMDLYDEQYPVFHAKMAEAGIYSGFICEPPDYRIVLLGGSSFLLDASGEVQYQNMFAIRDTEGKWVIELIKDQPVSQEFDTFDSAIEAILVHYQEI